MSQFLKFRYTIFKFLQENIIKIYIEKYLNKRIKLYIILFLQWHLEEYLFSKLVWLQV